VVIARGVLVDYIAFRHAHHRGKTVGWLEYSNHAFRPAVILSERADGDQRATL
jgi:hypothetical protein